MEINLSKEIKVGIFAGLGIILFLVSIIMLGGDKVLLRSTYPLRVRLEDVQGLARGSVVSLEGVPVGNVHTLQFIPQSSMIEVTMSIDTEFRSRITEGARASVKTQGALGDKYIYLESGPQSAPPVASNSLLEASPQGDLFDVLTKKGAEFAEIAEVIKEMHVLLVEINADGRSAKLMQNLVSDSQELKDVLGEAKETIAETKNGSLKHLQSILKKLDDGDGTLGALLNDPTLHTQLSKLLGATPRNHFLTPMIRESIKETEH